MPTIWGHLENVDELSAHSPHVLVRTFLSSGTVIRVRANIVAQTIIARGTESIDVSSFREGEFVEVSYRQGREGELDAETIYVRPEQTIVG